MINSINKFGVKKRCIEGNKLITEVLLLSLRYNNKNFYVYENDYEFLGIVDKQVILEKKLTSDDCARLTLRDICVHDERVIYYSEEDDLNVFLDESFKNRNIEEVVIVLKNENKIIGIINSEDYFNEINIVKASSENEIVCYRKFSYKYEKNDKGLNAYAFNVNSQHGEDGIISAIFEKIGTTSKYAVEFGGWDGIYLSNIRDLIVSKGFSGLFIEGDPERASNLLKNYENNEKVQCEAAYVGFRGENTLDNIFLRKNVPQQIDLLSIDIDGYDYHVWDALKNYKPRVVIIEYNPSIPNEIMVVNPYNESIFTGSSAAAIVELGRKKGYSLVAVTETNLIFVVDEEFNKFEIYDNSLDALRPVARLGDGKYFQTYNQKIVFTGFNNYIWSGKPFSKQDKNYYFTNI